jgi:hypothetical protein
MNGKEFQMRLAKLFLVLLAAGLLVWGVQGVALAQSYPVDSNQAADSSGWIHTDSEGRIQMSPSEPAADQATMENQSEKGMEVSAVSTPPEDSSDSTAGSAMQSESEGNDQQSSQGD